jgi:hypothetical protein
VGGLNCDSLLAKVDVGENMRTRQAAGKDNLKRQAERTDIRKNSFAVRVVPKWNSLPDNIKEQFSARIQEKVKNLHEKGGRHTRSKKLST